MDISFQLYSSRNVASQIDFLAELARLGYNQVEGYGGVYDDPKAFRAVMDEAGLTMPSGHFSVDMLETDVESALMIARALGITRIYAPFLAAEARPSDGPGYAAFARRLTAIDARLSAEGLSFGWHNHDFELEPLSDGSIPLGVILDEAPDIGWEGDLAWVIQGGADPMAWLQRYGSRLTAVHVKDIAPDGEKVDEDGWADVGEGTVDWPTLTQKVREIAPNALMVMEHDNPSDATRFATTSIQSFKTY
ncbi:sugar phosphate isomerase/epimerase [Gymnodinialimonas sp. 2305UL16-5]|uniref:sugar phosphate isomerase/epimerase family protein n=1 Tax=Gymnodinialimonas mytili TaxID=3126503 RepID=UPI00309B1B29